MIYAYIHMYMIIVMCLEEFSQFLSNKHNIYMK